jgi:tetratricopeptide (TPR) repeat protein
VYGKLHLVLGDKEKALDCFARALEIYDEIKQYDINYYQTCYEYGRAKRDAEMLGKALAWFERVGNAPWVMRIRECMEERGKSG